MTETRLRRSLSGTLTAAVLLLGGLGADAVADPKGKDKTPDETPNDHPSGKDKSAESGGSGTQGRSQSDPDGMSNGGADKPGGEGGFDSDQDGNNGCGNDDDFEDDNNGNCGGRKQDRSGERAKAEARTRTKAEARTRAKARAAAVAAAKVSRAKACGHGGCVAADVDSFHATAPTCETCEARRAGVAGRNLTIVDTVAPGAVVNDQGPYAEVLGVSLTRGTVSGSPASSLDVGSAVLPRTGTTTAAIALGGVVLVAVGSGAVVAGRSRS